MPSTRVATVIAIEGLERSGKTTFMSRMVNALKSLEGLKLAVIKEPDIMCAYGVELYGDLNKYKGKERELANMFQVNRDDSIKKHHKSDYDIILSDRCFLSSMVYQGERYAFDINEKAVGYTDYILFLNTPLDIIVERRAKDDKRGPITKPELARQVTRYKLAMAYVRKNSSIKCIEIDLNNLDKVLELYLRQSSI